ncbi:hypothetical protein BC831DRAFT_443508 [Entophlyctis helioformis]|nr:hypothetical protein BC831DRAFT_478658 [Entophlyctis helioformis]KAI8929419.1 hypothetical protein BC831DRAFT_443508 [Entophlyctis helioformis]
MLSQKLTLETFALVYYAQCSPNATSAGIMTPQIRTLRRSAIGLWNASHTDLQAGSTALGIKAETDAGVLSLYNTANTYFAQMLALSVQFDAAVVTNPAETGPILDQLVVLRQQFLLKMNEIVNAYQIISDGRIYQLVVIESVLLGFTLIVLLLEVVFVIVPAVRRMRQLRADISSMD